VTTPPSNPSPEVQPKKVVPQQEPLPAPNAVEKDVPPASAPRRSFRDLLINPPSPRVLQPQNQGFVFQVGLTMVVAFLLATLFTSWTPGLSARQVMPTVQPFATTVAQILQPSPTVLPGAPTPTKVNPKLIGLVAGHWKNDSGAVCSDGLKEVDINLNIATRVQKLLTEAGFDVIVLKEFDARLTDFQAAALISIHNDSCDFINNDASGYKVASAMATRHPEQAALLTACLRARYGQTTHLPVHSTSVTPDMTSYHAFGEINENTPAAIIETGFMNLDREILTQHSDLVAQGVAAGILCFMRNEPLITPTSPPAQPTIFPLSTP
jgi:N-acetylmuramoyl-L-alanine amidase